MHYFDGRGLESALEKKWGEGSKAHSKGGRIENALPLMVEGSKAHSKGGRVENTVPLMVEGSKAHSKKK